MEFVGCITQASKNFTRSDWLDHIKVDDCLFPIAAREVRNPANGQIVIVQPRDDTVHYVVEGKDVGRFSWSQNDAPLIVVESVDGSENVVRAHALRIAALIGGILGGYPDF